MIKNGLFFVNISKIEEELANSRVLVDNEIEPYYSLNCFRNREYDFKSCFESCPRLGKCIEIFVNNEYVVQQPIKKI